MGENNEERIVMLTIKEAAALVEGLRGKNSYADHKGSGCTGGGADRVQSPSDVHKRPGAAHHGRQEISNQQGLVPQVSAWGDCVNK